jgi:hypothetical protein
MSTRLVWLWFDQISGRVAEGVVAPRIDHGELGALCVVEAGVALAIELALVDDPRAGAPARRRCAHQGAA